MLKNCHKNHEPSEKWIGYESSHSDPSNHTFIRKLLFLRKLTFFEGGGGLNQSTMNYVSRIRMLYYD